MSQNNQNGFYAHPQQPQNVYQQMGIPQPQQHLNYAMPIQYPPTRPTPPQPIRYSASNPPTSSFPNKPRPPQVQPQPVQQRQSQIRPLPAPMVLPLSKPPVAPAPPPSRPLPTPGKRTTNDLPGNSSAQITSSSPPKRRQSPPKFKSDPSSDSNSPIKQSFPSNRVPSSTKSTASIITSVDSSSSSSSPPKPSTTVSPSASSSSIPKSTSSDGQPPTKPIPVWKRTIPEIPAPVWGYAAGLVADPHPKLSNKQPHPPPSRVQVQTSVGGGDGATSRGGVHRREEGHHGLGFDYEEEDEDEEEEEEVEDTPKKRNLPTTVVEKKVVLRPKAKIDPYGGYEDVSPIIHNARKPVRPRSEIGDTGGRRMFGAVDTMSGTSRNGRMIRRGESESGVFIWKGKGNEQTGRVGHQRPRSAIEERELLILNARARNRHRNRNRDVESDYGAEEIHLAYDEGDDEDYEGDVTMNNRRRRRGEEELNYRPQSQPSSGSRLMGGGRTTAAGLPRPPAMVRDRDGGGFISHHRAERKIRGGPRSGFVSDEESEGNHDEGRRVGWPGDLPRLPRTPGGGVGVGRGYFDAARSDSDLDLDEPPPQASIMRSPSPGVAGGYVLQKRELESQNQGRTAGVEQTHHRRFEVLNDVQQRAQGPGRVYATRLGYHSQPEPQSQVPQHRRPPPQHRYTITPSPRKQQQTPAPPPTVGIESPYPVGGRDRMADMKKLERGERDAEDGGGQIHGRRVADVRNVPKVMVMGDNDDVVSPDRFPLPSPSSPRTRPQSMVMTHSLGGSPKKLTSPAQLDDARETPRFRSSAADFNSNSNPNSKNNNDTPAIQIFDVPGVYVSKPDFDDDFDGGVVVNISGPEEDQNQTQQRRPVQPEPPSHPNLQYTPTPSIHASPHPAHTGRGARENNGRGLACGGCHGPITHGRILSAMGLRWHPPCFKCNVCNTLLEHVSSYENDGKAYCHLDYHETFAPRCYSCETAIIDEQFISLDDPALGKRTYHTQHFFCAECGDPFLDPSMPLSTDASGELALSGDGEFEGFTVYKGYPYCEACHVRLRLPKCKRCKKAIRDHEEAVEALGGKWCWGCFVCEGCSQPFEDPSFFQRGNQPYCENCFSIMLRNEI